MRKRTLFVIGAGASVDFRLPLGSQLVEEILELLEDDFAPYSEQKGPIALALRRQGLSSQHTSAANELRAGLLGSGTIDEILGTRGHLPGYAEIGKLAIAAAILNGEANSPLAHMHESREDALASLRATRTSWIATMLRHAVGPATATEAAESLQYMRFVVFNYDRCLERYLFYHLRYVIGMPENDASSLLQSIPIHHVFGSLGDGVHREGCIVPFGTTLNLGRCAGGIRTFTERDTSEQAAAVTQGIYWAEQIVILGFGFAPTNVQRLFPVGQSDVPVFATTRGMPALGVRRAREHIGPLLAVDGTADALWAEYGEEIFG